MSHTYPVPGSEGAYPAPRYPDLRLRVVPNESMASWWPHLGELVQALVDVGQAEGVSVELDTSDRTRPGEGRAGAAPLAVIAIAVLSGTVGGTTQAVVEATVRWVRSHLAPDAPEQEGVSVLLYGPDGEVLSSVRVPPREGGATGGEPRDDSLSQSHDK